MGLFNNLNQAMPMRGIHHKPSILIVLTLCFLLLFQSPPSVSADEVVKQYEVVGPNGTYCARFTKDVKLCIKFYGDIRVLDYEFSKLENPWRSASADYTYDSESQRVEIPELHDKTSPLRRVISSTPETENPSNQIIGFIPESDIVYIAYEADLRFLEKLTK